MDVVVLLEVLAQREAEERSSGGGELHRGREAAVADREVAGSEMAIQTMDVAVNLEAVALRKSGGIDARAGDDDHAQLGDASLRLREGGGGPLQEVRPDTGAAGRDDADLLVGPVAELGPERFAVSDLAGVPARHVAGELEVLLGPITDRR
jgi:hypothetical protein